MLCAWIVLYLMYYFVPHHQMLCAWIVVYLMYYLTETDNIFFYLFFKTQIFSMSLNLLVRLTSNDFI